MWILHSYRWRRRFAWSAVLLVLAGGAAFAALTYSTTPDPEGEPLENLPAQIVTEEKQVPLRAADERRIRATLADFIMTAVTRRNVEESWELAGPGLKQGMTRAVWNRGDIPVHPYPAGRRGLGGWESVQFSFANRVGLEVLLSPRRGAKVQPLVVEVDLVRGRNDRWLVDYWLPLKFREVPEEPVAAAPPASRRPERAAAPRERDRLGETRSRANPLWWALPTALLALVVLLPAMVFLLHWHRNRRAERAYLEGRR